MVIEYQSWRGGSESRSGESVFWGDVERRCAKYANTDVMKAKQDNVIAFLETIDSMWVLGGGCGGTGVKSRLI